MGACRREELMKIETTHIEDLNTALLVHIPDSKTKVERQFVVSGNFYAICKKYMKLRPSDVPNSRFFLNYQRGKCTRQPIGINKFGCIATEVAKFLELPDPAAYTGHCLRRSSATILVDSGADITALKRHGGWRSTTVAEGYIDHSLNNKIETANKILSTLENSIHFPQSDLDLHSHFNFNNEMNSDRETNDENCRSEVNQLNIRNSDYEIIDENSLNFHVKNGNSGITNEQSNNTSPLISFNNCQNFPNLTINVYSGKDL